MAGTTLTALQSDSHIVLGELHVVFGAATAPRETPRARQVMTTLSPKLLSDVKRLARADLSQIEDIPALTEMLHTYREMASLLERLLERQQTTTTPWIRELLGTAEQIESVLEAIEDRVEDLEIATAPDVREAIEHLIAEVTTP